MKPIIFSGESVRAIREGRKTQTRRVVRPQPPEGWRVWGLLLTPDGLFTTWAEHAQIDKGRTHEVRSPYTVGDQLWVREGHAWADELVDGFQREDPVVVTYRTDGEIRRHEMGQQVVLETALDPAPHNLASSYIRWRPSIHMPRWASRLTLEVVAVRVERLCEISEKDAVAEGCMGYELTARVGNVDVGVPDWRAPTEEFRAVWDRLNAKRGFGWDSNPFVWAITFRVAE